MVKPVGCRATESAAWRGFARAAELQVLHMRSSFKSEVRLVANSVILADAHRVHLNSTSVSTNFAFNTIALDYFTVLARYGANIGTVVWNTPKASKTAPRSSQPREKTLIAFAGTGLVRRMPDRPLTIATYAAGASLAAITLVYCFGPTFFLDDDAANSSKAARKKGVVGLVNPANDCFINSVLQALAGLPELRAYLIREVHRRQLDGPELYESLAAATENIGSKKSSGRDPDWKIIGLQQGLVSAGLRDVLNALNERPIYKKTISAQGFIRVVEHAFRTRISRSQQDAQEFLQIIVERLAEEYSAGRKARIRSITDLPTAHAQDAEPESIPEVDNEVPLRQSEPLGNNNHGDTRGPGLKKHTSTSHEDHESDQEDAFPLEGKLESQVECLHCHFKPKPSESSFLTLTLNVPHGGSATTLNDCFDGMFKVEHIDDFTCDRCRLEHALQVYSSKLTKSSTSQDDRAVLTQSICKLQAAMAEDPEVPPEGVVLPDLASAPKRRIARHMRLSAFPKILAIHLSRSIWDPHSISSKNMARVSFPETLPLGGLLNRKTYRLLGTVTHKGGHNSGHYESFRRQAQNLPFSTPASMGTEGVYSRKNSPAPSPQHSAASSPHLSSTVPEDSPGGRKETQSPPLKNRKATFVVSPSPLNEATSPISLDEESSSSVLEPSISNDEGFSQHGSIPSVIIPTPGLPAPLPEKQTVDGSSSSTTSKVPALLRPKSANRKSQDRWWRISDDKIKENKTSDVLAMQREVYLLFYEMVTDETGS